MMQAQGMMQPRILRLSRHLTQEDAAGDAAIAATLARLREAATPRDRSATLICHAPLESLRMAAEIHKAMHAWHN